MRMYLAAGWYTLQQEQARLEALSACFAAGVEVYSPKDDFLYEKGVTKSKHVFDSNIQAIAVCDAVIASTEGKDMGTLFECGYAYGNGIPVIYYYKGCGPFNLMLSESSRAVFTDSAQLMQYLELAVRVNDLPKIKYKGDKE